MNRNELSELIQNEIKSVALEYLQGSKKKGAQNRKRYEWLSEEELDDIIFYGGNRPSKPQHGTLYESVEGFPKITNAEIDEFNKGFQQFATDNAGSLIFDKQKNGLSLILFKKPGGHEAFASGLIDFGREGKIFWAFSLEDGMVINSRNLRVSSENRSIIENLKNFYDAWEKEWRARLSGNTPTTTPPHQAAGPEEPAAAAGGPAGDAGGETGAGDAGVADEFGF